MSDTEETPFSVLLAGLAADGATSTVDIPADWRQGRTAFGGLAAALSVAAARRAVPGLPPLRGAQFAFIGPTAGRLRLAPAVLRRGRSVAFVAVDLESEAGLGLRALLAFGGARPSRVTQSLLPPPVVAPPAACAPLRRDTATPAYLAHFETRLAGPNDVFSGGAPDLIVWVRHIDTAGDDAESALIAIGDALPPSPVCTLDEMPPLSSVTWGLEASADAAKARLSDWFLVRRRTEIAADGYLSERLTVWSEAGTPLLTGSQLVAIFG